MRVKAGLAALLLVLIFAPAAFGQQLVAEGVWVRHAALAVAGTGDFVLVWSDIEPGSKNLSVFVRLYDQGGTPRGPAFLVHDKVGGDQVHPKVAADEQGNFVVVWQGGKVVFGSAASDLGVFAQRFDRDGGRLGARFRVSASAAGFQVFPNVAMHADGSFEVVWEDCPQLDRCPNLRVGRFSSAGQRKGGELVIPVPVAVGISGPVSVGTPHIAAGPRGFAVAWTELEACYKWFFESFPAVLHFTEAGVPFAQRFRLDDGDCEDATGWHLIDLTMGRTGASAAFFNGVEGYRNTFQRFEPNGDLAGGRRVIGKRNPCTGHGCETIATAAVDADSRFAVVWDFQVGISDPEKPYRYSLVAQFLDPTGRPLGDRFEIASAAPRLHPPFSAANSAFDRDGTLTVAWLERIERDGGRFFKNRLLFRQVRRP
jgi:hypothetical protein